MFPLATLTFPNVKVTREWIVTDVFARVGIASGFGMVGKVVPERDHRRSCVRRVALLVMVHEGNVVAFDSCQRGNRVLEYVPTVVTLGRGSYAVI